MFGLFKNKYKQKSERSLVGDLDALTRKMHYVRMQGTEWELPELTAREYAEFCALVDELEKLSITKMHPERVDEIYDEIFDICIPKLPSKIKNKLPLVDANALFIYILKRHGIKGEVEPEKKT